MDSTDDKQWKCGTNCQVGWRMKKQINLKYFFEGEGTTRPKALVPVTESKMSWGE